MAKETDGVVEIKTGKMRVTIQQLLMLLGACGLTVGGSKLLEKPATAVPIVDTAPAFVRLDGQVQQHAAQQKEDCVAQKERDQLQDRRTEVAMDAIGMLSQGVSGIDANVQTLREQMTEVQRDIKKLLERK